MIKLVLFHLVLLTNCYLPGLAQPAKTVPATASRTSSATLAIPLSNADLGEFPYVKTLPNYYPLNGNSDSMTVDNNRVYCFDGKRFLSVDGKTSIQKLNRKDDKKKPISEFDCIQNFDKLVTTLGGVKVYQGKLPKDQLEAFTGSDFIELGAKGQIVGSAYVGIVEYVIKTPQKEVWIQLNPYNLGSSQYYLLVVEKAVTLLATNTNKKNEVLARLERDKRAVLQFSFKPDKDTLLTESKDELLSLVGVFQAHPDWRIRLACHSAPVGPAAYSLALTEQRAKALKAELVALGVNPSSVEALGGGDKQPLVANDTEQGRLTNSRVEITRL